MKNTTEEIKNEEMMEEEQKENTAVAEVKEEETKQKMTLKERYEAIKNSKIGKAVGMTLLVGTGVVVVEGIRHFLGGSDSRDDACDYDSSDVIDGEYSDVE